MASTSNRKSEVLIVCNTQQAQEQLKQMKERAKAVRTEMSQLAQAGQTTSARYLELDREIKNLSKSISVNESNMSRIKNVLRDLANSSLRQVSQAARDAKKALMGMDESNPELVTMQNNLKKLNDQMKILKGEAANIRSGMRELTQQTDAWLSNAISKQQQLVDATRKGTLEYQEQKAILKRLKAEQNSRQATAATQAANIDNAKNLSAARSLPKQLAKIDLGSLSPDQLKAKLEEVNRVLNKLGANSPLRKDLVQQANRLQKALDGVDKEGVDVQKVLKNLKSTPLKDLQAAADKLEKEMKEVSRNTQEFANKRAELQKVKREIDNTTNSVKKQEGAWKKTFTAITSYMGVTMLIGKIQQMLTDVIKLNLKFSDQLADIRKVSGLAMEDINNLANRLAKIDTRTTIEELNQIAYAGAKLGIGKYGVEGLEGFVRAANQVNVALKEDLGEDALTALSKITEVMGLIPKMGVEKSMTAVGSAMFQLSASSTATAGNIVEFSKRLTGLAKVTGVTTDQLLGLASASDAMFLMPEVSATAFNKLFTSLQTKHNLIEKELSIEPGTINNLFSAGKAMDAMVLIFEKMKEKGNMNALQSVFKDLGSDGARLVNVMVTMAQNVDMLKDHLYIANEAFEEGVAVTNEYNIQQETAQAIIERASNMWEKAFVNPKGVDNVKGMAQAWYDFTELLTHSNVAMGMMHGSFNLIIFCVKALLALLPMLLTYFMFKGAYSAISYLVKGFQALSVAQTVATAKQRALNAAMKANIWILIASLVAEAVIVMLNWGNALDDAADSQRNLNEYMNEAEANYDKERRKLESYVKVLDDANTSQSERQRIIKKFNHDYQTYLTKLGVEVNSVDSLKQHYKKLNDEIRKKMYYQMRERAYDDKLGEAQGKFGSAVMNYSNYVNSGNAKVGAAFDTKYVQNQIDAGKDANAIYRQMIEATYGTAMGVWSNYDGSYITNDGRGTSIKDVQLLLYISQMVNASNNYSKVKKEIDAAFDPMIGDYDPFKDDLLGDLSNEAPDKDAIKAAAAARREQMKAWREELKQAQGEAKAIMDNIKNFYQRQITQVIKTANEEGWDATLLQSATDAIVARQNLALSQARKGIAGVKNEWETFKQTMKDDMLETADEVGYNESQVLLDQITQNNLTALHNKMNGLSANLGLPANAATDAIWKNATFNEKANETAEQRHLRERQRLMLEDNYTGKVNSDYSASMTKLGYFDVNEQQSQTLVKGGDEAKALLEKRAKEIEQVFANVRTRITDLVSIDDLNTDEGRNKLMEILFGKDWDQDQSELKEVFDLYGEDLQQFYAELIKYSDDYTEALKKTHERQKKLIDFQWKNSETYQQQQEQATDIDIASKGVSQYLSPERPDAEKMPYKDQYGTKHFMSSMGADPEVEAYRLKIEAAREYYNFLAAHGADAQTLREQEQKILEAQIAYAQQVASQIKQRISDVYALAAPVEDFGTSIGEAFATMTEDAEEGRKAMRKAIGDMINGFMKQTVEMTKEYMKRRIMQKMNDRLVQVQMKKQAKVETGLEDKKQDQLLETQELGGKAKEMLTKEVGGKVRDATQQIGQETLQMQQTQTQQEVQTESAKTQANTTMGIASGASKIIGSLGWWGIPLVAVITALLNGLLSFAMSKVSSLFGGGKDSGGDSGPSTKLVSGMLTYDSGNVQAFRGIEDGKTYPVVGSDGKVYAAKDGGELSTGLVEDPITTLVNGQPALVAEKGPEMIIGRETTAAMMMARPDILAEIVKFDRQRSGRTYRAYDAGNVADFAAVAADPVGGPDLERLNATMDALAIVLTKIQQNGIRAHLNKFGRGGLVNEAENGRNFMQHNSGDRLWNK